MVKYDIEIQILRLEDMQLLLLKKVHFKVNLF